MSRLSTYENVPRFTGLTFTKKIQRAADMGGTGRFVYKGIKRCIASIGPVKMARAPQKDLQGRI